eukprot:447965-Prorocentrum_minimum.AAC.1
MCVAPLSLRRCPRSPCTLLRRLRGRRRGPCRGRCNVRREPIMSAEQAYYPGGSQSCQLSRHVSRWEPIMSAE